jgi:thioredoxin 1
MNKHYALELNNDSFDESTAKGVALIDFWAPWCGPCRMLGPAIEELAEELEGQAVVAKINVDENQGLAARYGVMSIPALFILKDGEVVKNFVGVQSKDILKQSVMNQLG